MFTANNQLKSLFFILHFSAQRGPKLSFEGLMKGAVGYLASKSQVSMAMFFFNLPTQNAAEWNDCSNAVHIYIITI